jgi:hypothetical protein
MSRPEFFKKRLRKVIKTEIQHDYLGSCILDVKKTGIALKVKNQMATHFWTWDTLLANCECAKCTNTRESNDAVITFDD